VRTIIEMVSLTRLDCAVASAGLMRIALAQAVAPCPHRFGLPAPALRPAGDARRRSDLALELEAQTALVFRRLTPSMAPRPIHAKQPMWVADAGGEVPGVQEHAALVYESLECLGGNGYTEDLDLARYYREAPLNAIWEGSGNVHGARRAARAGRHPDATMDTLSRLGAHGSQVFNVGPWRRHSKSCCAPARPSARARFLCEGLAEIAAVAASSSRVSPFANAYADTRLSGTPLAQFGGHDLSPAVETQLMDATRRLKSE